MHWASPHFTASIDAAVTLLPDYFYIEHIGQIPGEWHAKISDKVDDSVSFDCAAATGPLALCLARVEYGLAKTELT